MAACSHKNIVRLLLEHKAAVNVQDTAGFTLNVWTVYCSLNDNALCGVVPSGSGTFTTEGITALCEGLKGSNVTNLR